MPLTDGQGLDAVHDAGGREAMMLGCKPSAPNDLQRSLYVANYTAKMPAPPPELDRSEALVGLEWGYLGNDKFNDCAVAAAGHAAQLVNWLSQDHKKLDPTTLTNEVVATYKDLAGTTAAPGPNLDPGTVLKHWQSTPIAGEQCSSYTTIRTELTDHRDWMAAIYLFGFAYLFVRLSDSVCTAVAKNDIRDWVRLDKVPDPTKDNGHCVIAIGYCDKGLKVVSWGTAITWGWDVVTRSDYEAYAVLLPTWASGHEPVGLDLAELTADVVNVKNGLAPPPRPPAGS
jgi:hypothetical protein